MTSFRVSHPVSKNTTQTYQTEGEKIADTIDLKPTTLKNRDGRFLYYPSQIPDCVQDIQTKSTEEYLKTFQQGYALSKPVYERENMVYDNTAKRWKLVPESELYKYTS